MKSLFKKTPFLVLIAFVSINSNAASPVEIGSGGGGRGHVSLEKYIGVFKVANDECIQAAAKYDSIPGFETLEQKRTVLIFPDISDGPTLEIRGGGLLTHRLKAQGASQTRTQSNEDGISVSRSSIKSSGNTISNSDNMVGLAYWFAPVRVVDSTKLSILPDGSLKYAGKTSISNGNNTACHLVRDGDQSVKGIAATLKAQKYMSNVTMVFQKYLEAKLEDSDTTMVDKTLILSALETLRFDINAPGAQSASLTDE